MSLVIPFPTRPATPSMSFGLVDASGQPLVTPASQEVRELRAFVWRIDLGLRQVGLLPPEEPTRTPWPPGHRERMEELLEQLFTEGRLHVQGESEKQQLAEQLREFRLIQAFLDQAEPAVTLSGRWAA